MIVRPPKKDLNINNNNNNILDLKILFGHEKKEGRAAYICKNINCIKIAQKSRRIEKSFSRKIDPELYNLLIKKLENIN